jgi:formylglycine-generating enzyme required for sulfatase activity
MFYRTNRIVHYIFLGWLITVTGIYGTAHNHFNKSDALTGSPTDRNSETNLLKEKNSAVGTFIPIPAGEFKMGSENGLDGEKPVHKVKITKPFEIGRYEVTQEQWQDVMGNNPSKFQGEAHLPVERVSWEDVQKFIKELNDKKDGYIYRLPTEAEWEYACRAGSTGDFAGNIDEMAWYDKNSGNKTHPVGQKKANAWGLHDMHGNVAEWCNDWYLEFYYRESPSADPSGPSSSEYSYKLFRGGSWQSPAENIRSASRRGHTLTIHLISMGFRLARVSS